MLITAEHVSDVILKGQKALDKVYGGNVVALHELVGPRRVKVKLWAHDPDKPGARVSWQGRRLHAASWAAFGVYILAALRVGAKRVQTGMAIYRSEKDFWDIAPKVALRNVGSVLYPVSLAWLSVAMRERAQSEYEAKRVLEVLAEEAGL